MAVSLDLRQGLGGKDTAMARGRASSCIVFPSPAERTQLEHWQRSTTIQAGLAMHAKIILWRAEGQSLSEIARRLELGRRMVRKWVQHFLNQRMAGLADKPGRGREPVFSPRGGGASGQDGLRAARSTRLLSLP